MLRSRKDTDVFTFQLSTINSHQPSQLNYPEQTRRADKNSMLNSAMMGSCKLGGDYSVTYLFFTEVVIIFHSLYETEMTFYLQSNEMIKL